MGVNDILEENARRVAVISAVFNPITGEGSVGERELYIIPDFPISVQWLPADMLKVPLAKQLRECGSIQSFLEKIGSEEEFLEEDRTKLIEQFVRIRCHFDFPFWAALYCYIKAKGGGEDVLFVLTRPQRRLVKLLEEMRLAGKPIRLVLLKARQWGGSTTIQLYMAWLQLVHRVGLNSLIIAHQGAGSDEINDMFNRVITRYPIEMLHKMGEAYNPNELKYVGVGKSGSIHKVPQRNCKIKIGTAERPDGCRGGDYSLVHLSEVGLWKTTDGKRPEDIVRSACSGVLLRPYTMIVYESTANGTGNFFQKEYDDAKKGVSQFRSLFIAWFDIDLYSLPFASAEEKKEFARELYKNRKGEGVPSSRAECGKYLWWLWNLGATLEAINWYIHERAKYTSHENMASEYPSDDVEAFANSVECVFDRYLVEDMRRTCREPKFIGELCAVENEGKKAFENLVFKPDTQGRLCIWDMPEIDDNEIVMNRYLVVVDIGGRSDKADWSAIVVFDRLFMTDGGEPVVVAQWYGHIDMDVLAWKSAQIAGFYDNALLVIESNTLETHDRERQIEGGDHSLYILNQIKDAYPNLYAREQSEADIREGKPRQYGFHTNVSTKPIVVDALIKAVRQKLYIERDERCLNEMLCYERKQNGAYGAMAGKHDDLLMTRAIGLHICFSKMDVPKAVPRRQRFEYKKKEAATESSF